MQRTRFVLLGISSVHIDFSLFLAFQRLFYRHEKFYSNYLDVSSSKFQIDFLHSFLFRSLCFALLCFSISINKCLKKS